MEDENGLELSLGLSCGGSSSASKNINGCSSDVRTDEDERGKKLIDDFKNFLNGGTDTGLGSLKKESVKPEENFFSNLSKATENADASTNLKNGELWIANDNHWTSEVDEAKRGDIGSKRKNLFEEINQQKKHDKEVHHTDLHEKTRTSHISITTDDGSTAENEDVADSEAEASTSRPVLHHEGGSIRYGGNGGLLEACKEVHRVGDASGVESQGQKRFAISSEKDFKVNRLPYGVPFSASPINIMNMPYPMSVKESNSVGTSSASTYPSMMQVMPTVNNDRLGSQPVLPVNVPMMLGYSPFQLPVLDKDGSQALMPQPQQLQLPYSIRGQPSMDKKSNGLKISQASMPVSMHKASDNVLYDGRLTEQAKNEGKQEATEEGSSSKTDDDLKGSSITLKPKELSDQPKPEGFPYEFPSIRPGMAADIKFGGSGSCPNLPWVSTTGSGPNGRTISGVTYRYSPSQIQIVCACHGLHMSAEEFIQHANEDQASANAGNCV